MVTLTGVRPDEAVFTADVNLLLHWQFRFASMCEGSRQDAP